MVTPAAGGQWRKRCRRAEALGYDLVQVPDHLGLMAPFPALVAAAGATERVRVGTFVLNAGFWNPALLAREAATTDALTEGRLDLGLGTGYVRAEHESAGLPWGTARERVDHLRRTVEELERLFASPEHQPRTVREPGPRLLIGGNGDRMLRFAARHADTVAFTGGRPAAAGAPGTLLPLTAAELDERVAAYAGFASGRERPAELNLLIQAVLVTDDRQAAVHEWLSYVPHLSEAEVLELPILTVGTVREIVTQLRAQRARYGFTSLTVLDPYMEAFAPVLRELRRLDHAEGAPAFVDRGGPRALPRTGEP